MLMLWSGGIGVAAGLLVGSFLMARPPSRHLMNRFARSAVVYQGRDRQVLDDYLAYAKSHPKDTAAQREAQRRSTEMKAELHRDSTMALLVGMGAADTTFRADFNSPRKAFADLLLSWLALAALGSAAAIPVVLAVVTLWWAVARRPALAPE